jgi:predicted small metal-binding protein
MLGVACKDIGIADCDFVAEGKKARKAEGKLFDHLRDQHPEVIAGLAGSDYRELERRIRNAIMPAPVHAQ